MKAKRFDTRSIAPYAPGFFIFTQKWKDPDRVQVYFEHRTQRRRVRVDFEARHSLLSEVCYYLETYNRLPEDSGFIPFFMSDMLGAWDVWEHVLRVQSLGPISTKERIKS